MKNFCLGFACGAIVMLFACFLRGIAVLISGMTQLKSNKY